MDCSPVPGVVGFVARRRLYKNRSKQGMFERGQST